MIEHKRWWSAGAVALAIVIAIALWADSTPRSSSLEPPLPEVETTEEAARSEPGAAEPVRPPTEPGPEAPPPEATLAVRGRVLSRVTGEPIARASVTILELSARRDRELGRLLTGADGRFGIRELPAGARRLRVRARGHAPRTVPLGRSEGRPAGLDLEIWLEAERRVAGRVVDGEGSPVAQARVAVAPTGEPATLTDEKGRFEIEGLASRPVILWAHHPDVGVATSDELAVGRRDCELMLVGPVASCGGTVLSSEGDDPVAGAHVWIEDPRLAGCEVITDAEGHFFIEGLPAEPVRVGASAPERGTVFARIDPRGDDSLDLVLRLPNPQPVAGYVVEQTTGDPLPGIGVRLAGESKRWEGVTDAAGHFRTDGPFPLSPVRLTIASEDGWVIASPKSADGVTVELARRRAQPRRIVLAPGSQVDGLVEGLDGSPIAGCSITLISEAADLFAESIAWTWSDHRGRFQLGPIARAGRHRVIARRPGVGIAWSPSLLLRPSERTSGVRLTLTPAAILEGHLVDRQGNPVPGATITLERRDGVPIASSLEGLETASEEGGAFRLGPVPAGSYRVLVATLDSPEQIIADPWEVEGDRTGLEWVFDHGARLEVSLVDDFGEVLAGARVVISAPGEGTIFADADRRGRLVVDGLEAGPYLVQVLPGDTWEGVETECIAGGDSTEVVVPRRSLGGLVGRLVDARGVPLRGQLWIQAESTGGDEVWRSDELVEGRFAVPLPPGDWRVLLVTPTAGTHRFESLVINSEGPMDLGVVSIDPLGDLEGSVIDGEGRPVPAAQVSARGQRAGGGGPTLTRAMTDELGRFRLPGLAGAGVALLVEAEGFSARTFDIDPETSGPHQLTIERGGDLTVEVRDGEGRPLAGVIVLLRPIDTEVGQGEAPTRLRRSDESGTARFEHLSPGTYRVLGARYLRGPGFVRIREGAETMVEVVQE